MNLVEAVVAALVSAPAALALYLRSKKGRTQVLSWIKRLFNVDITADDLRAAIENMSQVVDAQGSSIDWLTQQQEFLIGQLEAAKAELAAAREQLKELEELHRENAGLRKRVAELEEQVKALEDELARRKKYTPKAKRSDAQD